MRLRIGSVVATAVLAGCKIVQTSTSGGSIAFASGGYNDALNRGLQVLTNTGSRTFEDQSQRRLGRSARSPYEVRHTEHRFLDFNSDCTLDIVPQNYAYDNGNGLAWLNDGIGQCVTLKITMLSDTKPLFRLT